MAQLSDFIISRVRVKLLSIFLSKPNGMYYVRELTRMAKEEINAIRRELKRMQDVGMLKSEKRGNRLYYTYQTSYPFYPELLNLVIKSSPVGQQLIKNKSKLGFIKYAFLSQKLIRGIDRDAEHIDLLIIGKVIMPQLSLIVKKLEKILGSEINYSSMTEEEYKYRKSRKDPFITSVLLQPRTMIIGDETKLLA
ncbi:hypothetical protein KJ953_03270 [Patescibacteria group bacterium]|nr:hypothetical protein [Patescibacteria group bacterium]